MVFAVLKFLSDNHVKETATSETVTQYVEWVWINYRKWQPVSTAAESRPFQDRVLFVERWLTSYYYI